MLLESIKVIITPNSSDTLLVFPFDQYNIKFKRDLNENVLEGRYSEKKINQILDQIEATCDHFWTLKKYIILTLFTSATLAVAVILGSIFINIGLKNDTTSGINFVKYEPNYYVYTGGIVLGIGGLQFILLMICISVKSKYIRLSYEEKATQIIEIHNEICKDIGIRWKLGNYLRWIEVRLDFKIKIDKDLMYSSTIDVLKSPNTEKADKEYSPLFQINLIKLDVD